MSDTTVTLYQLRRGANESEDGYQRITAWAQANGLDASEMPEQGSLCVKGGELTATVIVHSVAEILPTDVVDRIEVRRTVPLVERPPDDLFHSHSFQPKADLVRHDRGA